MQLIDAIEFFTETGPAWEYQIYLVSLVLSLIEYGNDPRNALNTILNTIKRFDESIDDDIVNYLLITMSQIIHNIAPFYLRNALEIVKVCKTLRHP